MVKGISRQVIVVQSPETQLFEQAIFILKDEAVGREGVTDEMLLREARRIVSGSANSRKRRVSVYGLICAASGALLTGVIWLGTVMF